MEQKTSGLLGWIDERFPLSKLWQEHLAGYYAPKNFNFWYFFGSLALFILVMQIFTGIFLTMHYKPDAAKAFASVEYIMRDVEWGWLIRYMHSTGRVGIFCCHLSAHVSCAAVRFIQKAARAAMACRNVYLCGIDGRGIYGLFIAVGANVLLGCASNH